MKNVNPAKKFTLCLGLAALFVLNSCTETEEIMPTDDINGKWTAVEGVTEISHQGMSAYDYAIFWKYLLPPCNFAALIGNLVDLVSFQNILVMNDPSIFISGWIAAFI